MRATMSDQFLRYTEKRRMSESMVERVARAICPFYGAHPCVCIERGGAPHCPDVLAMARAAIAAMMEPTEAMREAGAAAVREQRINVEGPSKPLLLAPVFAAMISAALSESVPATSDPSGLDLPDLG